MEVVTFRVHRLATVATFSPTIMSEQQSITEPDELPAPPPANFASLVVMLGTQALGFMGHLPDMPGAGKPRLDYAKHYIDLLALIEQKCKGNLATEEYDLLADWLHQLRMSYVNQARK